MTDTDFVIPELFLIVNDGITVTDFYFFRN